MIASIERTINEVNYYANRLRKTGMHPGDVDLFIVECYIEVEKELEILQERYALSEGIGDFFRRAGRTISAGWGGIVDTLKAKIAIHILSKMGMKRGILRDTIVKFVKDTDLKDIYTYVRGTNTERCSTISTDLSMAIVQALGDKVLGSEAIGLDTEGWMYQYLNNLFTQGKTDEGVRGHIKKWLEENVCGYLSGGFFGLGGKSSGKRAKLAAAGAKKSTVGPAAPSTIPTAPGPTGRETMGTLQESFQSKMKKRLRRQMKVLLDGGRQDLVKYGKPWNQGRQDYSNALARNEGGVDEASTVANVAGALDVRAAPRRRKRKSKGGKK